MAHVLVVDDDVDIAAIVAVRLEMEGHRVVLAHDGQVGLDLIRAERPELVVLDWMMPGLDGIAVCEQVRADPEIADTRILLLTARTLLADQDRALAAGADEHLGKPFTVSDLMGAVRRLSRTQPA